MTPELAEYWCVVCQRRIVGEPRDDEDDGNVFLHDDVLHPQFMSFDEQDNPQ